MLARGQGDMGHILEARRLGGSVEQRDPAIKGKPETGINASVINSS